MTVWANGYLLYVMFCFAGNEHFSVGKWLGWYENIWTINLSFWEYLNIQFIWTVMHLPNKPSKQSNICIKAIFFRWHRNHLSGAGTLKCKQVGNFSMLISSIWWEEEWEDFIKCYGNYTTGFGSGFITVISRKSHLK